MRWWGKKRRRRDESGVWKRKASKSFWLLYRMTQWKSFTCIIRWQWTFFSCMLHELFTIAQKTSTSTHTQHGLSIQAHQIICKSSNFYPSKWIMIKRLRHLKLLQFSSSSSSFLICFFGKICDITTRSPPAFMQIQFKWDEKYFQFFFFFFFWQELGGKKRKHKNKV